MLHSGPLPRHVEIKLAESAKFDKLDYYNGGQDGLKQCASCPLEHIPVTHHHDDVKAGNQCS